MQYRIVFHSHVFVHKAHAVFFRLSEPRKALIMVDHTLIGMQFFREPCFSGGAVYLQFAGDFETFAPVFLVLVHLAGQSHAGSWGRCEQEFRLAWCETETALVVEDCGAGLIFAFLVEFRYAYSHGLGMFCVPAQGDDGILRPAAVGHDHGERGLCGYPVPFGLHIGCDPVEHEPMCSRDRTYRTASCRCQSERPSALWRRSSSRSLSGLSLRLCVSTISSVSSSVFRRFLSSCCRHLWFWGRWRVSLSRWEFPSSWSSGFFYSFPFAPFPMSGGFS